MDLAVYLVAQLGYSQSSRIIYEKYADHIIENSTKILNKLVVGQIVDIDCVTVLFFSRKKKPTKNSRPQNCGEQ